MADQKSAVLAIIPARGGSKGIPRKNLYPLAGKPLIVYSIETALRCLLIDRVIVSTDSQEIADVARAHGAEVPFMRPSEFAQDHSPDIDVFVHALQRLAQRENYTPDICVHLRPTYPIRHDDDLVNIIQIMRDNPAVESVRSVAIAPETPFKMWFRAEDGILSPVVKTDIPEAHSLPRQVLPVAYLQNANIDAIRSRVILEQHSMTGKHIYGYVMAHNFDIDTPEHIRQAEAYLMQQGQQS